MNERHFLMVQAILKSPLDANHVAVHTGILGATMIWELEPAERARAIASMEDNGPSKALILAMLDRIDTAGSPEAALVKLTAEFPWLFKSEWTRSLLG